MPTPVAIVRVRLNLGNDPSWPLKEMEKSLDCVEVPATQPRAFRIRQLISPRTRRAIPKKRIRLKRRGRLSWSGWWTDWSKALMSKGWKTGGISRQYARHRPIRLEERHYLYLSCHECIVELHISPDSLDEKYPGGGYKRYSSNIRQVLRIVRGRQPDTSRGIKTVEDGKSALNICPLRRPAPIQPYLVEFDGRLYEGKTGNESYGMPSGAKDHPLKRYGDYTDPSSPWTACTDPEVTAVHAAYLSASPHYKSIRSYHKKQEHGDFE